MPTDAAREEARNAYHWLVERLPPAQRALVWDTQLVIRDYPQRDECALVGLRQGNLLLGLYTAPPPRVAIFEQNARKAGVPIAEVLIHEMDHRLGLTHEEMDAGMGYAAAVGCLAAEAHTGSHAHGPDHDVSHHERSRFAPQDFYPREDCLGANWQPGCPTAQPYYPRDEGCPVCAIHRKLAESERLMAGLAMATAQQGQIPHGLGGTIPLAHRQLAEAQGMLGAVAQVVPERQGQVRALGRQIAGAQAVLGGQVTPRAVLTAHQACAAAWRESYELAWAAFSRGKP